MAWFLLPRCFCPRSRQQLDSSKAEDGRLLRLISSFPCPQHIRNRPGSNVVRLDNASVCVASRTDIVCTVQDLLMQHKTLVQQVLQYTQESSEALFALIRRTVVSPWVPK